MGVFRAFQHYLSAFSSLASVSSASYASSSPQVNLPSYGSFTGTVINSTLTGEPLPAAVEAWLGIDYASQPIGEEGRFKPVGPLAINTSSVLGVKDASQYGNVCIQDPATVSYAQDEACLNMNVYRKAGNATARKLPVLVWIHGVSIIHKFFFSPFFRMVVDFGDRDRLYQARVEVLMELLLCPLPRNH